MSTITKLLGLTQGIKFTPHCIEPLDKVHDFVLIHPIASVTVTEIVETSVANDLFPFKKSQSML